MLKLRGKSNNKIKSDMDPGLIATVVAIATTKPKASTVIEVCVGLGISTAIALFFYYTRENEAANLGLVLNSLVEQHQDLLDNLVKLEDKYDDLQIYLGKSELDPSYPENKVIELMNTAEDLHETLRDAVTEIRELEKSILRIDPKFKVMPIHFLEEK